MNKIIPEAPQIKPPAITIMMITRVFIFNRAPTANGNIIYASRICTMLKTRITPSGYQIELNVIQETAIGNKDEIIIPT